MIGAQCGALIRVSRLVMWRHWFGLVGVYLLVMGKLHSSKYRVVVRVLNWILGICNGGAPGSLSLSVDLPLQAYGMPQAVIWEN